MTTVNLACREGHTFEAWFRSKAEFSRQHAEGLVACPWCGERDIERRPSVPNVMRSRGRDDRADRAAMGERRRETGERAGEESWLPSPSMQNFANTLRAFHRYIEHTCDDVGDRFAFEARKMHEENEERQERGEQEKRAVSTRAEVEAEVFSRKKRGGKDGDKRGDKRGGRGERKEEVRGIYGQATAEELRALEEEGISVSPLPPLPSRHN